TSLFFFFSSRRRHTRWPRDWSSDVCSSDLSPKNPLVPVTLLQPPSPNHRATVVRKGPRPHLHPGRVTGWHVWGLSPDVARVGMRSEERRVGKEGRVRGWPNLLKEKREGKAE